MRVSSYLTLLVVFLVIAVIWHQRPSTSDPVQVAAIDTMALIARHRDFVHDTIHVKEKAKARVDSVCCKTVTDTQLVIQPSPGVAPETVTVRAPIVERIRADSSLLSSLYADRRLDSLWHIQDAKLPHKPESPWGIGFTAGVGCGGNGCGPQLTAGVTYRVKLPKLKLPLSQ